MTETHKMTAQVPLFRQDGNVQRKRERERDAGRGGGRREEAKEGVWERAGGDRTREGGGKRSYLNWYSMDLFSRIMV